MKKYAGFCAVAVLVAVALFPPKKRLEPVVRVDRTSEIRTEIAAAHEDVVQLSPSEIELREARVQACLAERQAAVARREMEPLLSADASPDRLRRWIAWTRLAGDRPKEIALRSRLRAACPDDEENLEALRVVFGWENRAEEEAEIARELLARRPNRADVRLRLAQLRLWNGRLPQAMRHLEILVRMRPGDPIARSWMATALRCGGEVERPEEFLPDGTELAFLLESAGRIDEARDLYLRLGDFDALLALLRTGSESEELPTLQKLASDDRARRALADHWVWRKEFRKAPELYESLRDPRGIETLAGIGDVAAAREMAKRLGNAAWIALLEGSDPVGEERRLSALTPDEPVRLQELLRLRRAMGLVEKAREAEDALLRLRPNDGALHAEIGLRRGDRRLLERADATPEVLRALAEIDAKEGNTAAAIDAYRRYHQTGAGDAASHEALFFLLLAEGRLGEAEAEATSDLHRGLVAYDRGNHSDAARLLTTPDVGLLRARSLFTIGRWQEAQELADPELHREIEGAYGGEGSGESRYFSADTETHLDFGLHYHGPLSQAVRFQAAAEWLSMDGDVGALDTSESHELQRVEAIVHWMLPPGLRIAGGIGAWESEEVARASGLLEVELREQFRDTHWSLRALGEIFAPWTDLVAAAAFGGVRHRAQFRGNWIPLDWVFVQGSVEERWYRLESDRGLEVDRDFGSQTVVSCLGQFRLWRGEEVAGRGFYDLPLDTDHTIETQIAVELGLSYWLFHGDVDHLNIVPLVEEALVLTIGPSAGYATDTWGIHAKAFVGADPIRDLAFGDVWRISVEGIWTPVDGWKLTGRAEYGSEQLESGAQSALTLWLGVNHNF